MAINKNATIRYQALNQCFRNPGRNYYIDDLVEACNNSLMDIDPDSTGIIERPCSAEERTRRLHGYSGHPQTGQYNGAMQLSLDKTGCKGCYPF
jgi:hypothetical protein